MLISHKGHTDTIQVYSVTVMTHVKALQAGHSSQGTSEPITPVWTEYRYLHNKSAAGLGKIHCILYIYGFARYKIYIPHMLSNIFLHILNMCDVY